MSNISRDEEEIQKNKANELRDALIKAGFKVTIPIHSKTDFGRSTYLYLINDEGIRGKKFRISDHDTGTERFWNEYHYTEKSNVNDIVNWVKNDIEKSDKKYIERLEKELPEKIRKENAYLYWNTIKEKFDDYEFKTNDRTFQKLEEFSNPKPKFGKIIERTNIYQKKLDKNKSGEQAYSYEYTVSKEEGTNYPINLPSVEWIEWYRANNENKFKQGGKLKTYWYKGLFN
jgi:hypothetical protein